MTDLAKKRQEQLAQEGKEAEAKEAKEAEETKPPEGDQPPPPPPQEEPAQEARKDIPGQPHLPETDEICNSCGKKLKWIPVNSRIRAIVCTAPRCPLYYQRLRVESDPPPKPAKKKRPAKKKGEAKDAGTSNRSSRAKKPKEA